MAEGLDIRYKHVVERIDWGVSGATVHCSGGESFDCDAVICTVSLGVLKVKHQVIHSAEISCSQLSIVCRLCMI